MSENWSNRQSQIDGAWINVDGLGTPFVRTTGGQRARLTKISSRNGNKIVGYTSYKKSGRPLPWTVFNYTETVRLYPVGSKTGRDFRYTGVLGETNDDPLVPSFTGDPQSTTRIRERASNNLLKNIKDQKVNMGTMLAESGKSMKMIADTATKIYGALRAVRKGRLAEAAEHLGIATSRRRQRRFNRTAREDQQKAFANAWLEMQYGWKPLYNDIYNAAREMADNTNPIYKAHASGRAKDTWSGSVKGSGNYNYPRTFTDIYNGHVDALIKCDFVMVNSVSRRAALNGLSNPLMVAWELVPYSFVVDWFLPIGNYLELIDATNGLDFVSGGQQYFKKHTVSRQTIINSSGRYYDTSQGVSTIEYSRAAISSFPSPVLPSFQNPLSLGHAANAVALIINLWK